ncbi:MAG: hypothetical protein ACTSR8_19275 [Promethearchaeota archaeon]
METISSELFAAVLNRWVCYVLILKHLNQLLYRLNSGWMRCMQDNRNYEGILRFFGFVQHQLI